MDNKIKFKPFDKVLVRDKEGIWGIDLFGRYLPDDDGYNFNYMCLKTAWDECIPYEGNEHLLGTSKSPEIIDLDNNILFGIELKVGYVLEFENSHIAGVIIPTNNGLAVSYFNDGCWDYLKNIITNKKNNIVKAIRGPIENDSFIGGKVLWHK